MNEVTACATNESKGSYTWAPCPAPVLPQPHQLICILNYQGQYSECYGRAEEGNLRAVDGFGDWDLTEGQGAVSLILCILHVLHVNTSVSPSSCNVAEYNSNVTANQKKKRPCFHFKPFCTEIDRQRQMLWDTVQSCTARHPSVTSVALWTSAQLCQDGPDSPGFADASFMACCGAEHLSNSSSISIIAGQHIVCSISYL